MQKPELYNLDAERSLIGAVLIAGSEVLEYHAVQYIKAKHFYDAKHRLIWQSFERIQERGEAIDVVSISYDVGADSGVDSVYLNELVFSCDSFVRADQYANIIIDQAKKRYAEVAIKNLGAAVYDNGHFGEALEQSIDILNRIKTGGPGHVLPWDVYTIEDAYKPRDPLVYVVEGLFCLPSLNIVYGAPGCLKSMLLADMALCVAAGLPWLDAPQVSSSKTVNPKKTVSVPVLWLDFDNGTRRTHERIDALAKARNIEPCEAPFYYVSMPTPWLKADEENSVNALATLAISKSVGMIIIDNLGNISGDADENSSDMVDVFANLRKMAEKTESAVIVVHHQRKSTGFKTRHGETLRGHSSIEGALDIGLLVMREEKSPNVEIISTKERGADIPTFGASFAYEHTQGTKDLAWARFFGTPVEDKSKPGRARSAVIKVLESIDKKLNKGQLVAQAKGVCDSQDGSVVGKQFIVSTITTLVQDGTILEEEKGRDNARLYSLA